MVHVPFCKAGARTCPSHRLPNLRAGDKQSTSTSPNGSRNPYWSSKRTTVVGVRAEAHPVLDGSRSPSRIIRQHRDNTARYGLERPSDKASYFNSLGVEAKVGCKAASFRLGAPNRTLLEWE